MKKDNSSFEQEHDLSKDVIENNIFDLEYCDETGEVTPTDSIPGNSTPLAIMCFIATALFLAFGLFLFFSDVNVTSMGFIESEVVNKIIALLIMIGISLLFFILGVSSVKKAKIYYKQKNALESEEVDETAESQILQRTCPKCGETHDIDYPKCPNCKYNYLE